MEEIRSRHAEIGAGISVRYNMNCDPLKRSDGKNEDASREGGGELTMYDLLFADDSVFFTKGFKAKSMEMGEIVIIIIIIIIIIKGTRLLQYREPVRRGSGSVTGWECLQIFFGDCNVSICKNGVVGKGGKRFLRLESKRKVVRLRE